MLQITEKPEDALSAEDLRDLCYQIATDAHMASLALQMEDDWEDSETLLAINRLLHRWKDQLEDVAGGYTFDRLNKLEETAVAS